MGIEAMLSDSQTGGYNWEGSQANIQRLTNLILLIAITYTASSYHGNSIKKSGTQRYICRLTQTGRKDRRHSNFWVGMYGELWVITWEYLVDIVQDMIDFSPQKKSHDQRGLKALSIEYTI